MIKIYATRAGEPWGTRELIWQSDLNSLDVGVYGAKLKLELNKAGSLDFTVSTTHPYYHKFKQMTTMLTVVCGDSVTDTLFRGRVSKITVDTFKQKKITAEEVLIFLNDSKLRPIGREQRKTPRNMFNWAVAQHNAEFPQYNVSYEGGTSVNVNKEKIFSVGTINLTASDGTVTSEDTGLVTEITDNNADQLLDKVRIYSESSYQEAFRFIESELIDELGGYLRVHYSTDYVTQYLDWLNPSQYGYAYYNSNGSSLPIRSLVFGLNIIDVSQEANSDELFTVLLASGDKKLTPNWSPSVEKQITVFGLNGVATTVTIREEGDKLIVLDGLAKYGYIYHAESFGGVTNRTKLTDSAERYVTNNYRPDVVTYKVKAIDDDLIAHPLRLGEKVYMPSRTAVEIQNENEIFPTNLRVTQVDYDLQAPENTQYTIGFPIQTLTEKERKASHSSKKKDSENEQNTEDTRTETKEEISTLENTAIEVLGSDYVERGTVITTTTTTTITTDANGVEHESSVVNTSRRNTNGIKFKDATELKPGNTKSIDSRIQDHRHKLTASIDNDGILHLTLGEEVYLNYGDGTTNGIDSNGRSFVNFNMANSAWFLAQKEYWINYGKQQGAGNVSLPSGNVQLFTTDSSLAQKPVRVYYKLSSKSSYSHYDKRLEYSATYPNDNDL